MPAVESGARRQQDSSPTSPSATTGCASAACASSATRPRRWIPAAASSDCPADQTLPYDRLVLSPGIDFLYEQVAGLQQRGTPRKVLHAWKAGPQTVALRRATRGDARRRRLRDLHPASRRIAARPVPTSARARWRGTSSGRSRRSKVLILDGERGRHVEEGPVHEGLERGLQGHRRVPAELHADRSGLATTLTAKFETADDVKADVLNVIPPQRAGAIAAQAGVVTANNRWCEVDFLSFESIKVPERPRAGRCDPDRAAMPKSGHMANQHGKVAAAAILNALAGRPPNPAPVHQQHLLQLHHRQGRRARRSVHQYDTDKKTLLTVPGSGGLSPDGHRRRGRIRVRLGAEHLGRHADLARRVERGRRFPGSPRQRSG